jgi:N-6 DNA methylase
MVCAAIHGNTPKRRRVIDSRSPVTASKLKPYLRACGYTGSLLRSDYCFGDGQRIALAGFAHVPTDTRSACIAVVDSASETVEDVSACRAMGAPLVFACRGTELQWWKQGPRNAELIETIRAKRIPSFFGRHSEDFSPHDVHRAKTWGRFDKQYQLTFVDVGLMRLVESEIGEALGGLIERTVSDLKSSLGWGALDEKQSHWLLTAVFWLVSAKILRDKEVPTFRDLELSEVDDVFGRVAEHYGTRSGFAIHNARERAALREVAKSIGRFAHLGHVTTESLAYVYENTLISKKTRLKLGTHSTPSYLVDYIVGKLTPWIAEIPSAKRNVFEPCCGHAAFLVAAMRLLRDLLPGDWSASRKHRYLRSRLHGREIDAFALEIALLSLTLADVPNPDGWDLQPVDVFSGNTLSDQAPNATIFLANPPFENFSDAEKKKYGRNLLRHTNKTAEMLRRVLPALPSGAAVGVVVPQGILHNKNARDLREIILRDFELAEVSAFPDKVFTFSDMESAILLGRKHPKRKRESRTFTFRRLRERDTERFKQDYYFSSIRRVEQSRFSAADDWDMRVPELEEVWQRCEYMPQFSSIATIGQGLAYKGAHNLPDGAITMATRRFPGAKKGFAGWSNKPKTHELPQTVWMNLDPAVIRRPGTGTKTGVPQILLNYAPVSRGPWRLKGLLDRDGHAITSRFIAVRPQNTDITLEYLWALCNSPLASAFAYCHLTKRDNLAGTIRSMPVPNSAGADIGAVSESVSDYLAAVRSDPDSLKSAPDVDIAQDLMLQVDAEVLSLYDLPPRMERQLLDLFAGWKREGVPFTFERYYPEDYEPCFPLHEYLSEAYERSTAGYLRTLEPAQSPPELTHALRAAVEAYQDEE